MPVKEEEQAEHSATVCTDGCDGWPCSVGARGKRTLPTVCWMLLSVALALLRLLILLLPTLM
jgi:hypothetical protein